jgi:hypothetical protein
MHRWAFAAVFAAATPLSAEVAAGDCASSGLGPRVLNAKTAAIVDGEGGLVVGALDMGGTKLESGDVSVQKTWQFNLRGKKATPKIETLAPGLSVYHVPPLDAPVELVDDKGAVLGALGKGIKVPRMEAPKVKGIAHESGTGRRYHVQVGVTLDGVAPAGVVALVLADASGKPRSWTKVDPKARTLYPFSVHSCVIVPSGTVPSTAGDRIVLYWIDAAGRKSEATKVLTIRGTTGVSPSP